MAYNKQDAEDFLKQVIKKLDNASVKLKYDDSTYQIADIPKEVEEELLDLIGWPLLEVLRIREVLKNKLAKADEIYWDKFFPRQSTEFLIILYKKIFDELVKRKAPELYLERNKAKDLLKRLCSSIEVDKDDNMVNSIIDEINEFLNGY
ncbi:MAG: hypothetical protein M0R03_16735 [Novosphingobium sp.]|nr:hypothetical protein [Novosphingobium sp.]